MVIFLFLLVLVIVNAAYFFWKRSNSGADSVIVTRWLLGTPNTVKKRARADAVPTLIKAEDSHKGKLALRLLKQLKVRDRLQALLDRAGIRSGVVHLTHKILAVFLATSITTWLFVPIKWSWVALPAGALAGSLPLLWIRRKANKRLAKFEEQFPDCLEFIARAMRSGHAFSVSLEMIHQEFDEPLASEFRRIFEEQNLGLPLDGALEKLSKRMPLIDVQFFISAVLLQRRTGGNLTEILDSLAHLIWERFKLRGRIRAISAHGRMTGSVLSCIPVVVGAFILYINPEYARFFTTDTTGRWMIGGSIALQFVGYGIMRKLVQIEI
jgi:tight adherence protein B